MMIQENKKDADLTYESNNVQKPVAVIADW